MTDMPYLNVAPPLGAASRARVDPKAIKDEKLRKQYESALAENAKKAEYCNQQLALRRLLNGFQIRTLNYLTFAYLGDPSAHDELSKLGTEAGIRKEFRETIQSKVK